MNMSDMGEERESICALGEKAKKEKCYPTTYLSSKKLPDIEAYDVGDEVELHSVCKVTGKRVDKDKNVEVTVETISCGITHKGDVKKRMEMGVDKGLYSKMKAKGMV